MPEQVIKNNGQNHIHQEYIQKKKPSNYLYSSVLYNFLCKEKNEEKRGYRREE